MSAWLDPLRAALDNADGPARWFFRDDDAGWDDQRLVTLLDCFAAYQTPIDLAVIPTELRDELAVALLKRRQLAPSLLGLHQHGYSHVNHEITGRKCEFGASRSSAQQAQDIRRGVDLLRAKLGTALDPIFTPPWNRCSQATADALRDLGYAALSRDRTADKFDTYGVDEIPVSVDWCKQRSGTGVTGLGDQIAASIARREPVGVMLHHAAMDDEDLTALRQLLELVREDRRIKLCSMHDFIVAKPATMRGARQSA